MTPRRPLSAPRSRALACAISVSLLASAWITPAAAMSFHINGEHLIATGSVVSSDPRTLNALLQRAEAAGKKITTVVFRNSPGGAASGGVGMGAVIRERGLNTILDGGCFSACADAFAAGIERRITRFDLPVYGSYDQTVLGIHGAANSRGPIPYPGQEEYLDYYREILGEEGAHAMGRITQAHYELTQQSGFLRYFDPALQTIATRFCPTADTSAQGGCTDYPGVTIFSDTIANRSDYARVADMLNVQGTVRGNINPNYAPGSVEDAYGIVRLGSGSQWSLDTTAATALVWVDGGTLELNTGAKIDSAERILADHGGRVSMRGGQLSRRTSILDGVLEGYGSVTALANVFDNSVFQPAGLKVSPGSLQDERGVQIVKANGAGVGVLDGATARFSVTPDTQAPALQLLQSEVIEDVGLDIWDYRRAFARAQLSLTGARLALDVQPGYYAAQRELPLVAGAVDPAALSHPGAALCALRFTSCDEFDAAPAASDKPFIVGAFDSVAANGGKSVDLSSADALVYASANSLLSFRVLQSADKISLIANPAFEDTALFANAASGDGLGVALRAASYKQPSALAPVLGALQFADRDVARAQAGALRGDGHATLRLADRALADSFGNVLTARLSDLRSGGGEGGDLAAVGAMQAGGGAAGRHGADLSQLALYLNDPGTAPAGEAARGANVWGRGFGSRGRIDRGDGVAQMGYTVGGAMFGADTVVADGRITIGGSLGFASMSAKTAPTQFRAEVDAIDLGAYLDGGYSRGYFNASLRYTDLKHDTTRSIQGIDGLGGGDRASYRSHALSAKLEHGLGLGSAQNWQLLLPVIDYSRHSGVSFRERGDGAAPLSGRSQALDSLRVGAGVQYARAFTTRSGETLTPHLRLLWQKELRDHRAGYLSAFQAEPGLPFAVNSQDGGETQLSWNLGLNSQATERLSVLIDYAGRRSDAGTEHGVMLGLGYRF
ncbi:autotransporter domain-containing protein [Pseudomonas sp. CGJS7]|uniref:autotransporter domain-containing protein n=1 Tax=Pseudomonas sp. CGJS7 TaxID=3109348 RepID=UPI003007FC23